MPEIDRTKITVVHINPATGHVLEPVPLVNEYIPATSPFPTFATVDDAVAYSNELVTRLPHLQCEILYPGQTESLAIPTDDAQWYASEARREAELTQKLTELARLEKYYAVFFYVITPILLLLSFWYYWPAAIAVVALAVLIFVHARCRVSV